MPSLTGFSDNSFLTKGDVFRAAKSMISPLIQYFSIGRARVTLPIASGAQFDENAAGLEGFARPLWVVAALLANNKDKVEDASLISLLEPWMTGFRHGIDPSHEEYWGSIEDWDQRMVEAEIISFALLAAPESFYEPLEARDKTNLVNWLKGLNGKVMPENNWRWFRVLSNVALIKVCGVGDELLWPFINLDLDILETFYISDGWASDGVWRGASDESENVNAAHGRHADYYSGSFALQFSQMLYSKFAIDLDPYRCSVFRERAKLFAHTLWAYFDEDGAPIPFGRSLCYKFAMGGFYAAFAYAGLCDDSNEFTSFGAVKGMLLRHLRWWAANSENIFWPDGTLNIGYLYPNMYMSEDYNSPQSPYWAVKSLLVIALPWDDGFWSAKELAHPLSQSRQLGFSDRRGIMPIQPARQIACNHPAGKHHFLLSSGQFCVWPMKATQAKYAKFAYSSAFGFSVPTGPLLSQIAPDSTLALSKDNSETWAVRWVSIGETKFVHIPITGNTGHECSVTALASRWQPWSNQSVEVETMLVPPCSNCPDWHVRVHRIRLNQDHSLSALVAIEGGFAIDGRQKGNGRIIPTLRGTCDTKLSSLVLENKEVALEMPDSSLIISSAGASGIVNLLSVPSSTLRSIGQVLKPDPNTNLITPRTLLPTIKHSILSGPNDDLIIVNAVFAISAKGNDMTLSSIDERWSKRPEVKWDAESGFCFS